MAKKKTAAPPVMVQVARLDPDGVYLGAEEIEQGAVTAGHVVLPDGCDLPPGKYYWDDGLRAFMPLHTRGA